MFELMVRLSSLVLPVFIFCTMANVGMTQDPTRIVEQWKNWRFYVKVLAANFIAAPAIMWVLLQLWPLPPTQMAGLAVLSLCAGAPFLIKLTAASEHDLALGAATMLMLVIATIVLVPLMLPVLLPRVSVDSGAMAWTLIRQLLLPIVLGALLARLAPRLNGRLQPIAARIGNIALYVVLASTMIGYLPETWPIVRSGALAAGLAFILAAFAVGRLAGWRCDELEDIAGLATAQRNTAAAMLIGANSFTDPSVFVLITLVNALGLVVLIVLAKIIRGDNVKVEAL